MNFKEIFTFRNKVIFLSSIILVLALILVVAPFSRATAKTGRSDNVKVFGSSIKSTLTNEILLSKGGKSSKLIKQDSSWFVDYNGNLVVVQEDLVAKFLEELKSLSTGRLVEKKVKDFEQYGLGANATKIEVKDIKGHTFVLMVGSQDESYQKKYIRLAESESVYLTQVASTLTKTAKNDWADLKVFSDINETIEVIKISIDGDASALELENKLQLGYQITLIQPEATEGQESDATQAPIWKMTDEEKSVVKFQADLFAKKLSSLEANDIVFDQSVTSSVLKTSFVTIKFTGSDMKIRTLNIGKKNDEKEQWYVKSDNSKNIYLIDKSTLIGIVIDKNKLLALE